MFERFSEGARRCVFWARYEAGATHSSSISAAHLLAGIRRERPSWYSGSDLKSSGFDTSAVLLQPWWKRLSRRSLSGEIPLDDSAKRSLRLAAEAAERFHSPGVGVAHLFFGVFQADQAVRVSLEKTGFTEARIEQLCRENAERSSLSTYGAHRSGFGYDLHRLAEGRKLIVGGLEIPFDKGPLGHSDGDVLAHSLCDALLGAAGLGDIGAHFPDSDPRWTGVSSLLFLEHVRKLLDEHRFTIEHLDATVILERPKLGPHFPAMREALARSLGIEPSRINLKAKTNEGVDAVGRGEAIAAHVVATLVCQ